MYKVWKNFPREKQKKQKNFTLFNFTLDIYFTLQLNWKAPQKLAGVWNTIILPAASHLKTALIAPHQMSVQAHLHSLSGIQVYLIFVLRQIAKCRLDNTRCSLNQYISCEMWLQRDITMTKSR